MMRKSYWLAALGCLALAGCDGQDTDRLACVGRKVDEKFHALTGGPQEKLSSGWLAMRKNWDAGEIDTRVSARLRWDKALADMPIQVSATDGVVELKGKVAELSHRQRAVGIVFMGAGVL